MTLHGRHSPPKALKPDEVAAVFTKEAALDEALWRAVKVWGPELPYEKRELVFEAAKALIIAAVRKFAEGKEVTESHEEEQ